MIGYVPTQKKKTNDTTNQDQGTTRLLEATGAMILLRCANNSCHNRSGRPVGGARRF